MDLSDFDTSKVTSTEGLFSSTSALETLDLSSWDVGGITSSVGMFSQTGATKGYAKNQEAADFLNGIAPSTLKFTVKQ